MEDQNQIEQQLETLETLETIELEIGLLYLVEAFYDTDPLEVSILVLDKYPLVVNEKNPRNIQVPQGKSTSSYLDFLFSVSSDYTMIGDSEIETKLAEITPNLEDHINSVHIAKALVKITLDLSDLLDYDIETISITYVKELTESWVKDTLLIQD